jgi:hypothetical protein
MFSFFQLDSWAGIHSFLISLEKIPEMRMQKRTKMTQELEEIE